MQRINHKRTQIKSEPQMGFELTTLRVLDRMLLRTRWRARVIFVGWTCEPHLAVTQSITNHPTYATDINIIKENKGR